MSKLEVDTIAPQSGTTVTLGESGDTVTVPSGATLDTSNSTVTLPDDSVTTAKINNEAVTPAKLGYNYNQFRNIIINGDMSIAQRGTSVSSITSSGYYTVDRMNAIISSQGTWTQSQSTDVPSGQGFAKSLKMDCTTADASPAASDIVRIQQGIEGQNLQYLKYGTSSAESTTLSFWVKSNKTGTYVIQLLNGAVSKQVGKTYTISSADTWEKKTITFPGDTSTALDNDNSAELYVQFCLGTGSDRSSGTLSSTWKSFVSADQFAGQTVNLADSTSNEWYITGVQLEAGTSASDFEFLPVDVNLRRCQRYYQKFDDTSGPSAIYAGRSYGATDIQWCVPMNCPLRASPSVSLTGTLRAFHGSGYNDSTSSMGVNHFVANQNLITLNSSGFSSIVDNRIYTVAHINNTIIEMSSEL